MRISDLSSDVCSSDLTARDAIIHKLRPLALADQEQRRQFTRAHVSRKQHIGLGAIVEDLDRPPCRLVALDPVTELEPCRIESARQIGRASCRERVCQYV